MRSSQLDALEPGTMALLLGPAANRTHEAACRDLQSLPEAGTENVLYVTFGKTPGQCLREWKDHADRVPARFGVVSVGDITRSTTADANSGFTRQLTGDSIRIGTANPKDVADIGTTISEYLELSGSNRPGDGPQQVVLCFHTLTALLQWNDLESTFQFLHILTGMLKELDAIAHFHLDPDAVDETTLATVRAIFDVVQRVPSTGTTE